MDFLDNMVKSSNAILKDRLNNPFGKQQTAKQQSNDQSSQDSSDPKKVQDQPEVATSELSDDQAPLTASGDDSTNNNDKSNSQFAAIAADAEAVTQKAVAGAKNFGNFLFSMANKAGQTVTQTAKQVKQAVENTNLLTDLTREQQEFVKQHGTNLQAGELPWTQYTDPAKANEMREQILTLSQDKRNFVRSPPNDANFRFDTQECYPIALSLLKEDPNLCNMRFELVPKLVSLLKRFIDEGGERVQKGWNSSRSSSGEGPDDLGTIDEITHSEDLSHKYEPKSSNVNVSPVTQQNISSLTSQGFESDESKKIFAEADDLKNKLRELNIGSFDGNQDENESLEKELQELQDFELISNDLSALDDEDLDKEIMELKSASKGSS